MDFFTFFVLVCLLGLLIYAYRIENRRQTDADKFSESASALTSRIYALEQQLKTLSAHAVALAEKPAAQPASEPAKAAPAKPIAPAITPPQPIAPAPATAPPPASPKPLAPPAPPSVGGIPLIPKPAVDHPPAVPAVPAHAAAQAAAAPKETTEAVAAKVAAALVQRAAAGAQGLTTPPPVRTSAHVQAPLSVPFESYAARRPAAPKIARPKITLESIGRQLPKVGITVLVLGVALYTNSQWEHVPPLFRILIFYVLGVAMLPLGIFFERKDKYKILGRVLIGGGWAIIFFTTYAMRHIAAARVIQSDVLDLFLMLAVAGAMVWHTLRYNSQLVTGCSFLLGFVAVSVSHETSFSMTAGAILALGLTVLVVRRQWFELEVAGIVASYANHFYWLYLTFERSGHQKFEGYPASIALMVSYWVIFRASYLVRKVSNSRQESISTAAGLLNPLFFLAVMKYQSFHPEWAFWALLTMGAVEFTLGQLPLSRKRTVPFQILSSLGATLMVMAVPFKYSGRHALELLWMAGAEAFLLAGVFTRERLFRHFGGIISLLVAGYVFGWPPNGLIYQAQAIVNGQPHNNPQLSIVLAVIAGLFYLNSHVVGRIWQQLFDWDLEKQALTALSFIASIFAVGAVYTSVPNNAVAVVLAVLVTALAWTGKQFRITPLLYQAHWIAALAIIDVIITGVHLDSFWNSVPERAITFGLVAALLYLSSNFVRMESVTARPEIFVEVYRWAGTGLIALVIWMQIWYAPVRRDWLIAVLWTALALTVAIIGQLLKRIEFRWQAFVLAVMSFVCALIVNFDFTGQFHHLSYRLISVTLVAGGIYLLTRWSPVVQVRPVYSWAGTILFGYLAFSETQAENQMWTPVLWIGLAALLGITGRFWKDRALLWQTHTLSVAATGWTIYATFLGNPTYHGTRTQLITVLITSAVLYGLTWVTHVKQTDVEGLVESPRIWQAYSWAGSLLLTWLAWYQLQSIEVSLAWGLFGVFAFEIGYNKPSAYLRAQAYVALAASFAHLFYSNFNTQLAVGTFDPHILLIVLLIPIYFWVYWRLDGKPDSTESEDRLQISYLLACMGTATVAALAWFELPRESVVVGLAALVVALLVVAWITRLQVFLYQALIMLGITAFRLAFHNFRNLSESFVSGLSSSIWAIALLAVGMPFAFLLRSKNGKEQDAISRFAALVKRPEQPLFFVAVGLTAALLYIRTQGMLLTLDWALEGVVVILGAFFVKEKSFIWTGLILLLLSSGKIFIDLYIAEVNPNVRYLAMIGVGGLLLVAGYLFAKNREALREYL